MVIEGRLERVAEQVLYGERLGEVRPSRLAGAGAVAEVDRAGGHLDLVVGAGGNVLVGASDLLDGQVVGSDRQLRLQQSLIDRAELADRQRAEIHRAEPLRAVVHQCGCERGAELGVGEPQRRNGGAGWADCRVVGEQPAVVGRHAPVVVAAVDGIPERPHVVPQVGCAAVEGHCGTPFGFGKALREARQGMVGIAAVAAVGEQIFVLGICHKQQPEQDHHHLLIGVVEFAFPDLGIGRSGALSLTQPSGDRACQRGDGFEVDALAQSLG